MLRFGERHGLIALNPLRHLPPIKVRDKMFKRALTWEEFGKLLDHEHPCGSRYGTSSTKTKACTCHDLWLMLGETGIRRGELAALRWSDIDFEEREVIIQNHDDDQGPKTPASCRRVPMSDRVYEMLQARFKVARSEFAFSSERGGPVSRNLRRKLQSCLKATGIDKHGVCLHSFRYSFTSWLIQSGVSPKTVMVLLGHRDIATTMRVYSQSFRADEKEAVTVFNAAAQKGELKRSARSHASRTSKSGFQLGVA